MEKNAEAFQQMAACHSAGRDLGQLGETLIQEIYNYLPLLPWGSRNELNRRSGRPRRCACVQPGSRHSSAIAYRRDGASIATRESHSPKPHMVRLRAMT